jgi:hypothetical protein
MVKIVTGYLYQIIYMFVYLLLLKSTLLYSYHPKNRPTNSFADRQGMGWRTQFTYAKEIKKMLCLTSRQSAKLFSSRRDLGLPQPLTRRRVCLPFQGGGTHSLAREGVGESQFRRGYINCGTLYVRCALPTSLLYDLTHQLAM